MSTPNFQSILNASPTEVERPKPIPTGTYLCVVGDCESGESSQKKTPFIKFALKPIDAMADVDATALTALGGLEGKTLSITFYITEAAVYQLDEFHQNCCVDMEDGSSRADRNDLVANAQILATVEHEIDERDPSRTYVRVRRTARAD
jgi:hypothetical protein